MKKTLSYVAILAACFVGTLVVFAFAPSFRSPAGIRVDYLASYSGELTAASSTVTGHVQPTQYSVGGASIKAGLQMKSAGGSYGSATSHTFTVNSTSTIYYSFWQGVTVGRDCKITWKGNNPSSAVVGTWGAYS